MEDIISSDTATWSLHEYPSGLCCCGVRRSGQSLCKPAKIAFFFVNIQQQCIVALDKEITEVNHNTLVNDESSVEVSTWCADIPHERSAPSVVTLWSLKAVRSANTGQLFISISKNCQTNRQTCLTTFTQPRRRATILLHLCSTPLSPQRRNQTRLAIAAIGRRSIRALGKDAIASSTVRTMCNSTFARRTPARSPMFVTPVQLKVSIPPSPGGMG